VNVRRHTHRTPVSLPIVRHQIGSTAQYRAASLCADTISTALDFGLSFPAGTVTAEGSSMFLFIRSKA
jgi:hypothetical protein